ncbi:MAG TPA: DNA internalization-related competence protein ComEC/Rec2, partial [Gammaproteobacteria bacterium]|nr:DNA internalization-related competence protein ComEC/Rec2 [Gammaproteobacteria bacterium]
MDSSEMDNRGSLPVPGLAFYAPAFLAGAVLLQQFSSLPDVSFLLLSGGICLLLLFILRRIHRCCQVFFLRQITLIIYSILLIIAGFIYSSLWAGKHLGHRLDESMAGRDMLLTGRVVGIPVQSGAVQRFELMPENFISVDAASDMPGHKRRLRKIRLSWYYGRAVQAGEHWQLRVRLKPPHGFLNPGGFDYEGWLFQQGIDATGYVRKSDDNLRLRAAPWWSINRWRARLGETIDSLAEGSRGRDEDNTVDGKGADNTYAIIRALAIGDRSAISAGQWRVFTATGTSHLMAISGLHIGLAFLFGFMLLRFCLPQALMKRIPAQHIAIASGMLMAGVYALLAGMTIPTQRALLMLAVLAVMQLLRRNHRPQDSLALALLLVLLFDPLAVLSAGFWFSFSAVAVIFLALQTQDKAEVARSGMARLWRLPRSWLRLQLIISLSLLPLSLFMFQQVSLLSPVANLLLIPWVSFLVVPPVLLAMLLQPWLPGLSEALFALAASLLQLAWPFLQYLADRPFALWQRGDVSVLEMLLASAGILLLVLYPRIRSGLAEGRPVGRRDLGKQAGIITAAFILILPLWFKNSRAIPAGAFQLSVLDVGQGLSAVIETAGHVLVFDSGARYSPRFDIGS